MFTIRTERLGLLALSYEQVLMIAKSRKLLESSLGLNLSNFELNAPNDFFNEINNSLANFVIPKVKANENYFEWYTHWIIIHQSNNLIIGGIGINGVPDKLGEVMIGYYIDKKYESQGYATEALANMVNWIFKNPSVKSIIADTLIDGYASQKVLKKNGIDLVGEVEEGLRWKLILMQ